LLLLTGFLVRILILIHFTFLSNIGSKRHLNCAPHGRRQCAAIAFVPCMAALNFDENVFGTCQQRREFPIRTTME
jgi:hypothetical protein